MSRLPWRKAKTLAMLANRRQWEFEFGNLSQTSPVEIETEQGGDYFISETSTASSPEYITTE